MNKTLYNVVLIVLTGLLIAGCANRGTPDGGPKDELPPEIIRVEPENFSINFNSAEIKIHFNEYIKLKNLQKQLIISPPMKTQPEITPLGGASKEITIKIFDTLKANTTYAFNFGNSIVDNNEGNPYPYYRYVFSTGSHIDSLTVTGQIIDALKRKPETFVNVGLYEVDSTFNDSIIYKEAPKYITNTLDSVTTFSIENIKAGKYMLVALKDGNEDYKFQQKTDQIGFYNTFITVPTDSSYTLKLFSEDLDFRASRPYFVTDGKIGFGYEGSNKSMKISLKSGTPANFSHRITKDEKTDTLYYWYRPKLDADSLIFNISNNDYSKDYTVRLRKGDRDSMNIKQIAPKALTEPFLMTSIVPLVNFDTTKVRIVNKDTVKIAFHSKLDSFNNTYALNFKREQDNNYNIQILPEAFEDFFGNKSKDTLNYSVVTKKESDYGYIRFVLNNAQYPLIMQLTNDKGEVKYEQYASKKETSIDFYNLDSGRYFVRVIHDANGNGQYDTGHYLKKIQPERVSHFEMGADDEVRPDWGLQQTLNFISE
ncbi:MAG: Ig-like domain-containing protein [Aestuariibaculum sp.]